MGKRIFEVLKNIDSPFDGHSVLKALKDPNLVLSQVRGALTYMQSKGTIFEVEPGKAGKPTTYRLPLATFSRAKKKDEQKVRLPGLDKEELTLDEQLEQAERERDRALGEGQTTLERIMRDKVVTLKRRIAERNGSPAVMSAAG